MAEPPRYAVLFKTHVWDSFTRRQFKRLAARAGTENLFILADETNGPLSEIDHDRVIRLTEAMLREEKFLIHPKGAAFRYNSDYPLYHFIDRFTEFAYIVTVEYDCVVNTPIAPLVAAVAARNFAFAGEPVRAAPDEWHWHKFVAPYYPEQAEITGRAQHFAVFSQSFVLALKDARLAHAETFYLADNHDFIWPNAEGFVGAEIVRLGVAATPLAAFGPTAVYGADPARPEELLPKLEQFPFIHPLLDLPRFFRSLEASGRRIEEIFDEGSYLGGTAAFCEAEPFLRQALHDFAAARDLVSIRRLRDLASRRGADPERVFNVARGKPATQSSFDENARALTAAAEAAGAVNGARTGGYGFHTRFEEGPWWCVDLEMMYPVREIRIHNRLDFASRADTLVVMASLNMLSWAMLHDHAGNLTFGGVDGRPLRIEFPDPVAIRFLRLNLPGPGYLHLDEVEVFV